MFSVVSLCSVGKVPVHDNGPTLFHRRQQDMFKIIQFGAHCTSPCPRPAPSNRFELVHHEEWTVRKRALGIRLKCLLVLYAFDTFLSTTYLTHFVHSIIKLQRHL